MCVWRTKKTLWMMANLPCDAIHTLMEALTAVLPRDCATPGLRPADPCRESCQRATALADSLARLAGRMGLVRLFGGSLPPLPAAVVQPEGTRAPVWQPCAAEDTLGRCLHGRALQRVDLRLAPAPASLKPRDLPPSVARLELDFTDFPRVVVAVTTGDGRQYLRADPDNGTVSVGPVPTLWWLGQDDRSLDEAETQGLLWLQFLTAPDPTRARMLTINETGALHTVPLAVPIPSLPLLVLRGAD